MEYSNKITYHEWLLLFLLFFLSNPILAQKGIKNNGARITISEHSKIVMSGNDFQFINQSGSDEDGIIDLDGDLFIDGPIYNNATGGEFFMNFNGKGRVVFTGTDQQIIGGSANIRFENIDIKNDAHIVLNRSIAIENDLNFIDGNLLLNGNSLYLEENGSVSGSLGTSMIIPGLGGYVYKKFSATGSFTFPIGDNTGTTEYTPVNFSLNSYSSITNAYFGINVSDEKYSENTSPSEFLSRFWNLQHSGITNPDYSVDFHYLTNDVVGSEADIYAARYYSSVREVFSKVDDFNNILYVNNVSSIGNYTGVDGTVPSVSVTSAEPDPTSNSPFSIDIDFSEEITGFELADFSVSNAVMSNLNTSDNISFTADVSPSADGTVEIEIPGGSVTDMAGNNNPASNVYQIEYDGTNPGVNVSTSEISPVNSSFQITITFSEEVSGFSLSDIQTTNGSAGNLTEITSDIEWTAEISPNNDGIVTVSVPSGIALDAAGNSNDVSNTLELYYDATLPDVTISSAEPDPTNSSLFQLEIAFSEYVSEFQTADINITNGSVSNLTTPDSIIFSADIQPGSDGVLSLQIPATVAFDSAGNGNDPSNEFTITYDASNPLVNSFYPADDGIDVAIGSDLEIVFDEVVNIESGNITIKRSADDTDFEVIDVNSGQVTGDGTTNITINPSTDFASSTGYYVLIDNTCFTDEAGNAFQGISASTEWNFTCADVNDPVILSTYPPDNSTNETVDRNISLKFSEPVFAQSGNITIKETSSGSTFETIDVNSGQVSGSSTDSIVINPSTDFEGETEYYVIIDASAFDDSEGNSFAGISSTTRWNFSTEDISNPVANSFEPPDGSASVPFDSDLSVNFNENIYKGSGNVTIKLTSDNSNHEVIDVTSGQVTGEGTSTVTINPSVDFASNTEYYVLIDAGAFIDANNNQYSGITSSTGWNFSSEDIVAPTVTISSAEPDPTNQSSFEVTIEFSEEVQSFGSGDVSVANGSCTNLTTNDNISFTASISAAGDGLIDMQIPAGVVNDLAGNSNEASSVFSIEYDGTVPDVMLSTTFPNPTNVSPVIVDVEFSEWVSGFEISDISTGNCNVTDLSTSDSITFSAELTPVTDGLVTMDIPAGVSADSAGNMNTSADQFTINYDGTSPAVSISTTEPDPTNQSPFEISVTFTETVMGFDISDIQVTNGTTSNLTTSDDINYSLNITPVSDGLITTDIPAGVAEDNAGNSNEAASQFTIEYYETAPDVTVSSMEPDPTNNQNIMADIEFSVAVSGFEVADVDVTNAQINDLTTLDSVVFTANVTLLNSGECTIHVPGGVAEDQSGNLNIASNMFKIAYDPEIPTAVINSSEQDPTSASSFNVTTEFSEIVTDLTLGDYDVTNASLNNLISINDSTFEMSVVPVAEGEVNIYLPENSVMDAAGNENAVSNSFSIYYDDQRPSAIISSTESEPTNVSALDMTIEFSEKVGNFVKADIETGNVTITEMTTTDSITFELVGEPQSNGEFTLNIPENVAFDESGHGNLASSEYSNVYDNVAPELSLSGSFGDSTENSVVDITATATEQINGFELADIQTTNCNATDITSSDDVNFTLQIEPVEEGTVNVEIPAGSFTDMAGNLNQNSSSLSFYFIGAVGIDDADEALCNIYSVGNKIIVTINKSGLNSEKGTIKVFNSFGEPLINKNLDKNDRYEFNVYGSTNVYFVKVKLNNRLFTKKLILMKE